MPFFPPRDSALPQILDQNWGAEEVAIMPFQPCTNQDLGVHSSPSMELTRRQLTPHLSNDLPYPPPQGDQFQLTGEETGSGEGLGLGSCKGADILQVGPRELGSQDSNYEPELEKRGFAANRSVKKLLEPP